MANPLRFSLIGREDARLRRSSGVAVADPVGDARARRVVVLVLAAATLGVLDLAFTLTYARSTGIVEMNPLARAMIDLGGAPQLVRFKLLSILISGGALYAIRRRSGAEWCAWISLGILVGLSAHWARYSAIAEEIGPHLLAQAAALDQRSVVIAD